MRFSTYIIAYLSEVGCVVMHFIVPNDGESSSWTCEGLFCGESGSAGTRSGQVSGCPVIVKCIAKCTFAKCKAVSSNWEGSHPAVPFSLASSAARVGAIGPAIRQQPPPLVVCMVLHAVMT